MRIERVWAMPNKWTFTIPPIKKLLNEEMNNGVWIDPYSGMNSPADITNDINPDNGAEYNDDALDFVNRFKDNSIDGALFDPPYSGRQIAECYKKLGLTVNMHTTNSSWYYRVKTVLANKIKSGGKAICFGWNSNGLGMKSGFELERVLLVAHGSAHNDTIVTVERKVNGVLF